MVCHLGPHVLFNLLGNNCMIKTWLYKEIKKAVTSKVPLEKPKKLLNLKKNKISLTNSWLLPNTSPVVNCWGLLRNAYLLNADSN